MIEEARRLQEQADRIMTLPNLGILEPEDKDTIWQKTRYLAYRFTLEVKMLLRWGTEEDIRPLKSLTHWRHYGSVLSMTSLSARFTEMNEVTSIMIRRPRPHVDRLS